MLRKIIIGVAGVVAALALIGFLLPRQAHVERSLRIDRPASMVYAVVNSFVLFPRWSPWQHLDPAMTQTMEGPADGVGATLKWSGNRKIGSGTQIITASTPNQSVQSDLNFGGMGASRSRLQLEADGGGTRVRWTLDSELGAGPVGRYFGLLMDHMVGADFASGLQNLKVLLEGMPNADIADLQVTMTTLTAQPVLLVNKSVAADPAAISKAYADAYAQIGKILAARHLQQAGAPFGVDLQMNDKTLSFDAGIPVAAISGADATAQNASVDAAAGAVRTGTSYAGKALMAVHVGPYEMIRQSYLKLAAYAAAHGYQANGPTFSRYVDDPMHTSLDKLRTEIYWPVK